MRRTLANRLAAAAIAALLLIASFLAFAHVPEADHCADACAICHARSARAVDPGPPLLLPAPAAVPECGLIRVAVAPRTAEIHPWAARAPPSAVVHLD